MVTKTSTVRHGKKPSTLRGMANARNASIRSHHVATASDASWRRRAALTSPIPNSGASFHTQGLRGSDGSDTSRRSSDETNTFAEPQVRYPRGSQAAWENVLSAPGCHVPSSTDGSDLDVAEVLQVALRKVGNLTTLVNGEVVPLPHCYCFDVEVVSPESRSGSAATCELHRLSGRFHFRLVAPGSNGDVVARLHDMMGQVERPGTASSSSTDDDSAVSNRVTTDGSPQASPAGVDNAHARRADDEEERFRQLLSRLHVNRSSSASQGLASGPVGPNTKTSPELKDPAIVAFEVRNAPKQQPHREPSDQAKEAANQYLAEQLSRMHRSSNSGSNDSGYVSHQRAIQQPSAEGSGQGHWRRGLNPATAEFKSSSQTEDNNTMPWLAPRKVMARQPLTNIFPDATSQGGQGVDNRAAVPTTTASTNTGLAYSGIQPMRQPAGPPTQAPVLGVGGQVYQVPNFGVRTAGPAVYPASSAAPAATLPVGSAAMTANPGGTNASLPVTTLGVAGAPVYPLNGYGPSPQTAGVSPGLVQPAPVLSQPVPISTSAITQVPAATPAAVPATTLITVPSTVSPGAPTPLSMNVVPAASGIVTVPVIGKPPRPYFPVTTKPRDHDPVKQQLYEAYLEWRKANEPGYHISCKMRQANRVLRQCQQQALQQKMGQQGQTQGSAGRIPNKTNTTISIANVGNQPPANQSQPAPNAAVLAQAN
jgi:hypothetical protein